MVQSDTTGMVAYLGHAVQAQSPPDRGRCLGMLPQTRQHGGRTHAAARRDMRSSLAAPIMGRWKCGEPWTLGW